MKEKLGGFSQLRKQARAIFPIRKACRAVTKCRLIHNNVHGPILDPHVVPEIWFLLMTPAKQVRLIFSIHRHRLLFLEVQDID